MIEECDLACKDSIWQYRVELLANRVETNDIILRAVLLLAKLGTIKWLFKVEWHRHVAVMQVVSEP